MVSIDPQRVIKQACIDEWQAQLQAHESERWHPDRTCVADVKSTQLFQIARQMVHRFSLGQAIESGQHALQTIGPRWWEENYPHKKWLFNIVSSDLGSLPTCYGSSWWKVSAGGVPEWQRSEFSRQMTMLRYSHEHIFSVGTVVEYSAVDIESALNRKLDHFAFHLPSCRQGKYDTVFAGPWDYWHFAQCLKANLNGTPYLYRQPR
ncbi:hypothetical protein KJZ63_02455 [Patescibacteria group bacterium]|nr:hypothetical protein [Patescibacteria group bacterium]